MKMNTKTYLLPLAVALIGCQNPPPNTPSAVDYSSQIRELREENTQLRSTIEAYDSRIAHLESSTAASVVSYQSLIAQLGGSPATIVAERRDRLASEAQIAQALLDIDDRLNTYMSRVTQEQARSTIQQALTVEQLRGNLSDIAALVSDTRAMVGTTASSATQQDGALRTDYQQKIDALERRIRSMEAHLPSGPAPSNAAQDAYERAIRGSAPPTPR